MEGKEQRFGSSRSVLFATSTTLTSTGAVNSMHDSFTPLGGMVTIIDMMFGELAPGGVGSGLYGFLIIAILAVFLAGLMIGRTPSYLGKQVGGREITFVSLYILTTPAVVLIGLGLTFAIPAVSADVSSTSILNPGPHGFSEVLYAFTSAGNNNGSAFAGHHREHPVAERRARCRDVARPVPADRVRAGARRLVRGPGGAPGRGSGTLATHRPQFILLTAGTVLVVSALTYFPVLALGPLAEGLTS